MTAVTKPLTIEQGADWSHGWAPVAASTIVPLNFGPIGKRFATGLAIAATAAAAATDTGVAVAGVQIHATYL